jgi:hypothetical protein
MDFKMDENLIVKNDFLGAGGLGLAEQKWFFLMK